MWRLHHPDLGPCSAALVLLTPSPPSHLSYSCSLAHATPPHPTPYTYMSLRCAGAASSWMRPTASRTGAATPPRPCLRSPPSTSGPSAAHPCRWVGGVCPSRHAVAARMRPMCMCVQLCGTTSPCATPGYRNKCRARGLFAQYVLPSSLPLSSPPSCLPLPPFQSFTLHPFHPLCLLPPPPPPPPAPSSSCPSSSEPCGGAVQPHPLPAPVPLRLLLLHQVPLQQPGLLLQPGEAGNRGWGRAWGSARVPAWCTLLAATGCSHLHVFTKKVTDHNWHGMSVSGYT
jgi:hypothetical protein